MTVVNAWLFYRRVTLKSDASSGTKLMSLHDFKWCIATTLCHVGKEVTKSKKRGRPSSDDCDATNESAKRRRPNTCLLLGDIRLDGYGHWLKWTDNKERCKRDGCNGMSRVMCLKCKVHLDGLEVKGCNSFFLE